MKATTIFLSLIIILSALVRLWDLPNFPAGFNADEAAIGYNAYSILQTGKDEYGATLPLAFKSFGDYKPGLYFYVVLPFIFLMGLTELAVRLPSALLGIGTVFLVYYLGKKIFNSKLAGLFSALILGISPWHIHFSRGGWESNAATFFITLGVLLFLLGLEKRLLLFFSLVSFLISMYLYQSPRLIMPIFILGLSFLYRGQVFAKFKQLFKFLPILVILAAPLAMQFVSGEGAARFSGLSFMADPGPISRVNELVGEHGTAEGTVGRVFHNKLTAFIPSFLGHYLDHFTPDFLFINGDAVMRNKVPETGQFYLVEAIFLIAGLVFLAKNKPLHAKVVGLWILVAPLASSMTFQTPSALRSLSLVVPLALVMGYGVSSLVNLAKSGWRFLPVSLIALLLVFEVYHYLESYFIHYPKRYPIAWEYGFGEMVTKLGRHEGNYNKVVMTDSYDQPYILMLFYKKYDPLKYQPQARLSPRDQFNFGTVRAFDKYEFRAISKDEIGRSKGVLFIGTAEEIPENAIIIDRVDFPGGEPAFLFAGT